MRSDADIRRVHPRIGLEVHVELATRRKMFSVAPSPAARDDAAPPNTLVDPTVLALPGSLPVMNRAAVEMAMLVGMALGCEIARVARWDRKHYFYPDLPKAYQISQYDQPLCGPGEVEVPAMDDAGALVPGAPPHRVRIRRAHLEEDAGKLLHEAPADHPGPRDFGGSIVDLNRAGTPLLEIVTEPDFTSADQAVAFARWLRGVCRFLGVTRGVMQLGHMRFEPNINADIELAGGPRITTPIVEVKNLNSFRSLRGAIEHELAEQPRRWVRDGREHGPGAKRTMGWDDRRLITLPQRQKEDAQDYRYFPDPDLPPVVVDDAWRESVRARLVESPASRMARYMRDFGVDAREAAALAEEPGPCAFFESCAEACRRAGMDPRSAGRRAATAMLQVGARLANERSTTIDALGISPAQAAVVIALREAARIGSSAADDLFALLCEPEHAGADPEALARGRSMLTVRDDAAIDAWCRDVLAQHAAIADQVRAGKAVAIGRLVGEVMKRSGGAADARAVRERLLALIGGP